MTQNFNGDKIIEWLLSWFRALFNDLIGLFSGSEGSSLLLWLTASWKQLLVVIMIIGISANIIIYMIRWRPHWWWFGKKRPVVADSALMKPKASHRTKKVKPSTVVPVAGKSKNLFEVKSKKTSGH